jgi:hypothetical protein
MQTGNIRTQGIREGIWHRWLLTDPTPALVYYYQGCLRGIQSLRFEGFN